MNNIVYAFKNSGFKRIDSKKYLRAELFIKIKEKSGQYSQEYEDNDFRIKITTNINKLTPLKKDNEFKFKIADDNSLVVRLDLISNVMYKKEFELEKYFLKGKKVLDDLFIVIVFYPKRKEVIGNLKMLGIKNSSKTSNPKHYKFTDKVGNKSSYIRVYHGGGCSGK